MMSIFCNGLKIICHLAIRTKTMALLDIFVGVPQSKYAGAAVLLSLLAVSVGILVGRDPMPMSQKFAFVLLIFLVSLPGLLLTLFQLTCMVTGTQKGAWWCGVYSWVVSALIIIYSVLLVIVAVMSLASSGKVLEDITRADMEAFQAAAEESVDHNAVAAKMFGTADVVPAGPDGPKTPEAPVPPPPAKAKSESFAIQGGSSVPAPVDQVEPFDDKEEEYESYEEAYTDKPKAGPY